MKSVAFLTLSLLGSVAPAHAHQIWIEQPEGETAVIRFGEYGENLREVSPGLLDGFGKPTATLLSKGGEKRVEPVKAGTGFTLPFKAAPGEAIVAEDAAYPLYRFKQGDREVASWYRPAARFATDLAAQEPKLALDIVPTGKPGAFRVVFDGKPLPKAKLGVSVQSGWSREERTDERGEASFDLPWKGSYVLEVSHTDGKAGERAGEAYDRVSYVTTLHVTMADGAASLPAGPAATPNKK